VRLCVYYDLSTGTPGRRYDCNEGVLDTVLWEDSFLGQGDRGVQGAACRIQPPVRGRHGLRRRAQTPAGLSDCAVENLRRAMSQLPVEAQHNIGYRNAWALLTGQPCPPGDRVSSVQSDPI
jgi:hypothetical protein